MKIQNDMWHQLSVSAVEQQLHTNASCGLSRKEARSRYRKAGPNTAFNTKKNQVSRQFSHFLTDPALLLFAFVCLLCLFFFEFASALVSLFCLTAGAALIIRMLFLECKLQDKIEKYKIPTVCVIRDGGDMIVSARAIVEGDLIRLKKGDVIPADCRLISSNGLKVMTLCTDEKGNFKFRQYPKQACEASILEPAASLFELENLLFCGSEILAGEARAIVIATGEDTLIASDQENEIPTEYGRRNKGSALEGVIRPYVRIYSFVLFALMIPLSILCFFFGEDVSFLKSILSVSAFVAIGSQACLQFYFRMPSFAVRSKFFSATERGDRIIFKSSRSVSTLASVSDLIVLGRGALSDGLLHLNRCALGDGELDINHGETYEALQPLCEALFLEKSAQVDLASLDGTDNNDKLKTLRRELSLLSGFDAEALQTRLLSVSASMQAEILTLDVSVKGGEYALLFSENSALLDRCTFYEKNRRTSVLSSPTRESLRHFMLENEEQGIFNRLIAKRVGTQMILLGILGLREELLEDAPLTVNEMKKNGLKPTFFLFGSFAEESCYIKSLGLEMPLVDASSMDANELVARIGTDVAFFGASANALATSIRLLSKQKRKVAVIGGSADDCMPMNVAALSVGYDTLFLDDAISPHEEREELSSVGCAVNVRRYADIMISRPQGNGGGLTSLMQGVYESRACQKRTSALFSFLLISHLTRLFVVLFSSVLLIGTFPSFQLLYCGLLFESLLTLGISKLSVKRKLLSVSVRVESKHIEATIRDIRQWLPFLSTSIIAVLATAILKWCSLLSAEGAMTALFCSLCLLELIALLRSFFVCATHSAVKQISMLALMLLIPIVLVIAFSVAFPVLSAVFYLGKWNLYSALTVLFQPLLYWIFDRLISSFFSRTAKK